MPTIPNLTEQKSAYPDAPSSTDVGVSRFGRDAAAMASLGGEIAQFGSKLMRARKQAEDADASSNAIVQDTIKNGKLEEEARLAGAGPVNPGWSVRGEDPINRSDDLHVKMRATMDETMKSLPSDEARARYRSAMEPDITNSYIRNIKWENQERSKQFRNNLGQRNATLDQDNYLSPSVEKTQKILKILKDDLTANTGTNISAEDAREAYMELGRKNVDTMIDGFANTADGSGSARGLQFIKTLRDPNNNDPLREVLQPGDLDRMQRKLEVAHRQVISKQVAETVRSIEDTADMYANAPPSQWGSRASQNSLNSKLGFLRNAALSGGIDAPIAKDQVDRLQAKVMAAEVTGRLSEKMLTATPAQMAALQQVADDDWNESLKSMGRSDPAFAYQAKAHFDNARESQQKAIIAARNKDPAAYVERYFSADLGPSTGVPDQNRISKRLALQKHIGVDKPTILSDSERDYFKTTLKNQTEENPEKAAETLFAMKESMGEHLGGALSEMTDMPEYFKAAAYMESKSAATSVLDNFKNKKDIESRFKDQHGSDDELDQKINEKFNAAYNAIVSDPTSGKNISVGEKFRETIKLEAKKLVDSDGVDMDAAVTKATDKVFGDNYAVIGRTYVPKVINGVPINMQYVAGAMQSGYDPKWILAQGGVVPKGIDATRGSHVLKSNEIPTKENMRRSSLYQFEDAVANGRWVTEPSGLTARFEARLRGGVYVPITKADGKTPITIDFLKVRTAPKPEALENIKPWYDKAKDAIVGKK